MERIGIEPIWLVLQTNALTNLAISPAIATQRQPPISNHTSIIGSCQEQTLENSKSLYCKHLRQTRPATFALSLYIPTT